MNPGTNKNAPFDSMAAAEVPGMRTVFGLKCPVSVSPAHSWNAYEASTSEPASLPTPDLSGSKLLAANQNIKSVACGISGQTKLATASVQPDLGRQNSLAQLAAETRPKGQPVNSSTGYNKKPLLLHRQLERDRNMAVLLLERQLKQLNQQLADSNEMQLHYSQQLQEAAVVYKQQLRDAQGQAEQKLSAEQEAVQLQQQQLLAAWKQHAIQQQQWHAQQLAAAARWHSRKMLWRMVNIWSGILSKSRAAAARAIARSHNLLFQRVVQAWLQAAHDARMQPGGAEATALMQHSFIMWQSWTDLQHRQKQMQHNHQQHMLQHAVRIWMRFAAENAMQRESAIAAMAAVDAKLHQHWGVRAFQRQLQESYAKQHMQQQRLQQCLIGWKRTAQAAARMERVWSARAAAVGRLQLQTCFVAWWQQAAARCRDSAARLVHQLQDALSTQHARVKCAKAQEAASAEQLKLLVMYNQRLQQQALDACRGALAKKGGRAGMGLQLFPSWCWRSLLFQAGESFLPRARHAVFKLDALQPHAAFVAAGKHTSSGDESFWHSQDANVGGCLIIFGGVSGSQWLADLTLLLIEEQPAGDVSLKALPVPHSTNKPASDVGSHPDTAAAAAAKNTQQLPLTVRDFAACACGPNQFVVTGGFGGQLDGFHLQLCRLQHQKQLDKQIAADVDSCRHTPLPRIITGNSAGQANTLVCADADTVQGGTGSTGTTSALNSAVLSWYRGWEASWQLLQSHNPGPPGRCHHSVCYYAEGRSLVVFGGWADCQGCLNDVWLFHQDHMEWWQPEATGAWPRQRRSHAAALLGHKLYVHGGLDSSGVHLDDMWCLNMHTWQWTAEASEGSHCPIGRRAHCLEVVAERYLLLHAGYAGEGLLGDTWVYDTCNCSWLAVEVQGPASELPVPRALHTVTTLQQRLLVLGGQGPLGPLGDVHFLECPAVQQGLQLLQHQQHCETQLIQVQQQSLQLDAELACSKSGVHESQKQLQVARQHIAQLQSKSTAAAQQCSALQAKLSGAQAATAAAQQTAQQASHQVAVLQRRLARARHGGTKAVGAAQSMEQQLRSAECTNKALHHQVLHAQQQLQQQQLTLQERNAEVAVLRNELAESSTRVNWVAAASNSAQSDLKTALTRSNKLYTQELKHLRQLLQAARESQQHLAHELATLQAQKAAPPPITEAATATAICCTTGQAATGVPALPDSQHLFSQQLDPCGAREIGDCQVSAAAAVAMVAKRSSSNADSRSQMAADDGWHYMGDAVGHAAQLLCMSADQLAAISSRQGRTQAQLELLQKQVVEQQAEMSTLKQQLQQEQNAARATAAVESELRTAAIQQLHQAEQQHKQQVKQLEEQVKHYKWKVWELEASASNVARLHQVSNDRIVKAAVWSSPEAAITWRSAEKLSRCALQLAGDVTLACDTTAVAPVHKEEIVAVPGESAGLLAAPVTQPSSGGLGEFTVRLLPSPTATDQLEMLPEVVKLFELHRSIML